MQRRVTTNFRRFPKKVFYAIIASVIIVLVVLFLLLGVILSSERLTCFDEAIYYYVYTESSNRESYLESQASDLQSLGGAGFIYERNDVYYLIASVYSDKADAEEVLLCVKENFPNAGILTLQTAKLARSTTVKLKQNTSCLLFFKFFEELTSLTEELSMKYLAGTISVNGLLSKLLAEKIELESKISEFDGEGEIFETVLSYMNLCKLYIDNFFTRFFVTTKKDAYACLLPVELTILRHELLSSL